MVAKPKFPCSECGSKNTELRDYLPHKNIGFLSKIKAILYSTTSDRNGLAIGQKFVVCKECGHISCIQIF